MRMTNKKRTKDDPLWMSLKRRVADRDRGCRLLRICSVQEYYILMKNAGPRITQLDPAHVIGVGIAPSMCYLDDNVVLLNRYSHDCLDNCKSPITGQNISREERDEWWKRIVGVKLFESLQQLYLGGDSNE